jgi:hypothetical protein
MHEDVGKGVEGKKSSLCMVCFILSRFYVLRKKWALSALATIASLCLSV